MTGEADSRASAILRNGCQPTVERVSAASPRMPPITAPAVPTTLITATVRAAGSSPTNWYERDHDSWSAGSCPTSRRPTSMAIQ